MNHTPPVHPIVASALRKVTAVLRALTRRYPGLAILFGRWACLEDCATEVGSVETVAKGENWRKARGRDEYALATTIYNPGPNTIEVAEDGNILLIVEPGQTKNLPTPGYGEITVRARDNLQDNGEVSNATNAYTFRLTQFRNVHPDPAVGQVWKINGGYNTVASFEIFDEGLETVTWSVVVEQPGSASDGAASELYTEDSEVTVTTARRCECGVTGYADDERPIGSDLL